MSHLMLRSGIKRRRKIRARNRESHPIFRPISFIKIKDCRLIRKSQTNRSTCLCRKRNILDNHDRFTKILEQHWGKKLQNLAISQISREFSGFYENFSILVHFLHIWLSQNDVIKKIHYEFTSSQAVCVSVTTNFNGILEVSQQIFRGMSHKKVLFFWQNFSSLFRQSMGFFNPSALPIKVS